MADNNDVFEGQGMTFYNSSMASTAPSAAPPPIAAPSIDMANAPANQTIPAVAASDSQPNAPQQDAGAIPAPPDPSQIAANLAGNGNSGVSGAAGEAPPQPPANPPADTDAADVFQKFGVQRPSVSSINGNAFNAGQEVPPPAQDDQGHPQTFKPELTATGDKASPTPSSDATAYAQNQQQQLQTLAYSRFSPSQLDAMKNNPIGFFEAFKKVSALGYTLGDQDADALKIVPIALKVQTGQPLSDGDQATMNNYLDGKIEMAQRGFTWGGKIAYAGSVIPTWALQFALSGGVGKLAEAGAARMGIMSAEDMALSAATRLGTQFTTMMVPHYAAQYGERQLNDMSAITDKGQLIMHQADESPAKAALMSFGYAGADVASQMLTPAFGAALTPVKNVLMTPITAAAKNLSPELTESLYQAWKAVNPSATVSKMFTAMGWNGMLEQVGAVETDKIMRASVGAAGGDLKNYDQFMDAITPSKDEAMVTAGLISIGGAVHASTALAVHFMGEKGVPPAQAQEAVANMTSLEKDAFVNQNMPLPQSEAPTLAETSPAALMAARKAPQGPASAKNIIASATNSENSATPPPIVEEQSGFNQAFKTAKDRAYSEMWNDIQPIEDLHRTAKERGAPISDTELTPQALSLAKSTPALTERQWTTGTTTWDAEGNQVRTGKGLKQIRDDFDNMFVTDEPNRDTRQADLDAFENAMTLTEDKNKGYSPVSDKDWAESQATLTRLSDKYGEKMKWFETFAKEERDWDNRILHNLVTSGLKTQAWYDDLVGKREWYSSTARVIEQEYPEDVAAMKGKGLGADVNPANIGALKQRGGSEREIMQKTMSRMRNSAIIIRRAQLNKVRNDVAKYAEYYPEQVKVKPPALIREAVQHSYDPKLRTKLEQISEFLGGQVKRAQAGEKLPQLKGNLGAYEPSTKTTYLRAGTTEGTLTHEIGHMLDYLYGLKDKLLKSDKLKAELQGLAEDRLRSKISLERTPEGKSEFAEEFELNPQKYTDYVKNDDEVLANFFDAWVNSPEQVERKAPMTKALFEKFIDNNPDLAALKQIEPSTQRAQETIQKQLLDFKGPKDSVQFYKNGRLMFLHIDPELARAFKGLDQVQSTMVGGFIAKTFKAQARLLQFGATNNPYFIARHFLRGAQSSYVNTPVKAGPAGFLRHFAIEIPKAIGSVIGRTDAYREWASSSGALRTFMDTSDKGLAKLHKEMFETGDMAKFLDPRNWAALAKNGFNQGWQTAKQVSDYAPRIAAYERMKAAGYSDLEAGFLSLEATGNYIRHGSLGKEINAFSPFFNDRLQGADRFLRAIKRDPAGYSLRALALITMPQLLVSGYYLFAADDKTRQEYLNLSDFRRSAAMNIKIDGHWIPFPRAFAPGFVFGALPEFNLIHLSGIAHPELKYYWLHMIGNLINSLSPSTDWTQTIPPLMKAAIEAKANFSFFRDMPIFHGDIKKTAPENQFNSGTSETAKALGNLFGISPANIDNTAYDMAAHIGVYAQQLGDIAINSARRLSGQPVNERPTKGSDNPLYGPMMQPAPVGTASESFQEFNQHVEDEQQQQNRYKEKTGKDQAEFQHDNHQDLALYPPINSANTQVHHVEHEIRMITENVHLSGDQKAQQIAQRQQQIQSIVEGANKLYRNVKGQK